MKIQNCSQIRLPNLASILCPGCPTCFSGRAAWAEIDCQIGLTDLATILDFHSVGYSDHLACNLEKSVVVWQGLIERQPGLLIHFPVNSETNDTACQIPYHISRHQDCNYEGRKSSGRVGGPGEDLRRKIISKARSAF